MSGQCNQKPTVSPDVHTVQCVCVCACMCVCVSVCVCVCDPLHYVHVHVLYLDSTAAIPYMSIAALANR